MSIDKPPVTFRFPIATLEKLDQIQKMAPFCENRTDANRVAIEIVHGLLSALERLQNGGDANRVAIAIVHGLLFAPQKVEDVLLACQRLLCNTPDVHLAREPRKAEEG